MSSRAVALLAFCVVAGPGCLVAVQPSRQPQPQPQPPRQSVARHSHHVIVVAGRDVPVVEGSNAFGSGEQVAGALQGVVYFVPPNTQRLPDLSKLDPIAVLYTRALDVSPRHFSEGFPGVHDRFEWFAVRYEGGFTTAAGGAYDFRVLSDDGSRVYVDDHLLVDNDGTHPAQAKDAHVQLTAGPHQLRVDYFQGPRFDIALQLYVTPPGASEQLWTSELP